MTRTSDDSGTDPHGDATAPRAGIHDGLEAEDYHAGPEVSVSRLKLFATAPAKARIKREPTAAQKFGTAAHTLLLEPERFARAYVRTELTREGTKAWAEQEAFNPGRVLIKQGEYDDLLRMRDGVMRHSVARELLSPGFVAERSYFWTDPETGLTCRARADISRPDMRVLADLKSCEDASRDGFAKASASYRYHWQDPFYREGSALAGDFTPAAFIFIAIEKEAPFLTATYEVEPRDTERGARITHELLCQWHACERSGAWPGYSDTLETLSLPPWSDKELSR